jgi:hypothetical protein
VPVVRMYRPGAGRAVLTTDDPAYQAKLAAWGWVVLADGQEPPERPDTGEGLSDADMATLRAAFGPFFVGKPGQKYRTLLGAIRNFGAGGGYWQPIADTGHHPTGIASVETTGTEIIVRYDFEASGIGTVIAVTDETMANEGYLLGASVAPDQAAITLRRRRMISDLVSWDGAKWVSAAGVYTGLAWSNGVLTLTHETIFGSNTNVSVSPRGGDYMPAVSASGSPLTATTTKVEFYPRGSNALATTPAAGMKAYVSRFDIKGPVDPRTAIDTTSQPFHNIWLFGLHEA